MTENEIATQIVDAAYHIHVALGPGLLETVYETALEYELKKRGLTVERQKPFPLVYEGIKLEDGFRADLVVNGKVIVEIKSLELVPAVAYKILQTYLRLANVRLGLMINFGDELIKEGIKRVVNKL